MVRASRTTHGRGCCRAKGPATKGAVEIFDKMSNARALNAGIRLIRYEHKCFFRRLCNRPLAIFDWRLLIGAVQSRRKHFDVVGCERMTRFNAQRTLPRSALRQARRQTFDSQPPGVAKSGLSYAARTSDPFPKRSRPARTTSLKS